MRYLRYLLLGCLLLFLWLAFSIYQNQGRAFAWDITIAQAIQAIDLPGLFAVMRFVSLLGNKIWFPLFVLLTAIGLLLYYRKRPELFLLLSSSLGGYVASYALKWALARPRPDAGVVRLWVETKSYSFPSGHVLHYATFYGCLFFLVWRCIAPTRPLLSLSRALLLVFFGGLVVLVGFSRVYLGAHWPSDVVGAYLFGFGWLLFTIGLYERYRKDRGKGGGSSGQG